MNLRLRGSSNEEVEEEELIKAQNTIEFTLVNAESPIKNSSVFGSSSEALQTS